MTLRFSAEIPCMSRRKAREEVLRILYPLEVGRTDREEILREAGEVYGKEEEWPFVKELVEKIHVNLGEIDSLIESQAQHWSLYRMPAVDRSILRMAVAEMIYFSDIPLEVTLNEAIELAKKYGGADSGSFVNGILAAIHRRIPAKTAVKKSL